MYAIGMFGCIMSSYAPVSNEYGILKRLSIAAKVFDLLRLCMTNGGL